MHLEWHSLSSQHQECVVLSWEHSPWVDTCLDPHLHLRLDGHFTSVLIPIDISSPIPIYISSPTHWRPPTHTMGACMNENSADAPHVVFESGQLAAAATGVCERGEWAHGCEGRAVGTGVMCSRVSYTCGIPALPRAPPALYKEREAHSLVARDRG